jgi:Mrp family chromosome partitioning ATPase
VNANFRTPLLPGIVAGNNHYGLADALRQEGAIRGFAKQGGRDNLWLLSSGAQGSDSLGLFNGDRMKERMAELRREFSFVLIDAPPLNTYGDALVVGRLVDGVVLVLAANSTRREVALRISEKLRAAKIRLLAAVLNKRTFPIPSVLYKWL